MKFGVSQQTAGCRLRLLISISSSPSSTHTHANEGSASKHAFYPSISSLMPPPVNLLGCWSIHYEMLSNRQLTLNPWCYTVPAQDSGLMQVPHLPSHLQNFTRHNSNDEKSPMTMYKRKISKKKKKTDHWFSFSPLA